MLQTETECFQDLLNAEKYEVMKLEEIPIEEENWIEIHINDPTYEEFVQIIIAWSHLAVKYEWRWNGKKETANNSRRAKNRCRKHVATINQATISE